MGQALMLKEAISLLEESLNHITAKPWDDDTYLHARISRFLGIPIEYADWIEEYEVDIDD